MQDCAADPSFQAFLGELDRAIAGKDSGWLLAIVAEDIDVDFGGGAGRAWFAETWALDRPETSRLWAELAAIRRLGCASDGEGGYWLPSMFRSDAFDDVFAAAVAIRPGATVHTAPDPESEVIATLDWDVLSVDIWNYEAPWQQVRLADGRTGFVRSTDIRSPIDYRALFVPHAEGWRLQVFIAGD